MSFATVLMLFQLAAAALSANPTVGAAIGPMFSALFQTPTPIPTIEINIDFTSLMSTTQVWVNALFPLILPFLGIRLAMKLIRMVQSSIEAAF